MTRGRAHGFFEGRKIGCSCRLSVMLTNTLPGNPTLAWFTSATSGDDARLLQRAHPAQARRLAQVNLLGQFAVTESAIPAAGQRGPGCRSDRASFSQYLLILEDYKAVTCFNGLVRADFARFHASPPPMISCCASLWRTTQIKAGDSHAHRRAEGIKVHEYRVGLVPAAARELVEAGHEVLVQTGAADGIGFSDADYLRVGAKIAATAAEIFAASDMIVKVKGTAAAGMRNAAQGQILYTYLHLAPDPRQTEALVKSARRASRTKQSRAGRLAAVAHADERSRGPHVDPVGATACRRRTAARHPARRRAGRGAAKVVILGGGVSGTHAAEMAVGLRAGRHGGRIVR